jgi:putative adhesin
MRRGSVIGPLILILIGALFLMRNLWPEIPIADIISRYWPFLLIAWGGLRLIEILFLAIASRPIPRNGVSGGEWMLVFLICIIGGTMYTARHYAGWFPTGRALRGIAIDMGESYDYTLAAAEKPCGKNCRVLIESFRGNAKISGSSDPMVKVSGHETIRSFQQADADAANKQTPLEVIQQGDQVIIRTNQDRVSDRMRVSSDLEITVPAGSSIEAHGRVGDFDVQNVTGTVDISSDNAGVRLENIGGNVRIDLRRSDIIRAIEVKGNIDLKGRGQDLELQNIAGQVTVGGTYVGQIQLRNLAQPLRYEDPQITISCEKLPGQLHMGLGELTATNMIGPVRVNGRSRDVQLSDFTQSLDLTLERGDIMLRPGKTVPKIEVHTRSGDIDLAIPPGGKFDLKATTDRGEVHNDYGVPLSVDESHRGATIVGSTGSGPQVRLETGRGSVTVRKASSEDMTFPNLPTPPASPSAPTAPSAPIRQDL